MNERHDTAAWIFQVWISFIVSFGSTLVGIYFLGAGLWEKAFLGLGLVFTVGSSLSLAKTIRDNHESHRFVNRIREARAEKLIHDFEQAA